MKDLQICLFSVTLGRAIPIRCLVPEGNNLKCLFLLHGFGGNQDQWCDESIITLLVEQYGLAVVMPHCGNGYYEDTQEDMPYFVGSELVSYIRKVLPVSNKKVDTYIAGISMGGFGALLIGAKFPNVFGKIVSLSGAFIIPDVVIGNTGVLGNADPDYFRSVFGDFDTLEGSTKDPVAEAISASAKGNLLAIFLLCGSDDVLYQGNLKVVKDLRNHNIPVVWYSYKGTHCWSFWNDSLPVIFKWLVEDCVPEGADNGYGASHN